MPLPQGPDRARGARVGPRECENGARAGSKHIGVVVNCRASEQWVENFEGERSHARDEARMRDNGEG